MEAVVAVAAGEAAALDSPRTTVLSIPVDLATPDVVWTRVSRMLDQPGLHHIVTLNPEQIMAAQTDQFLAQSIAAADLITIDGIGLELAVRIAGIRSVGRVTGVDLVEDLAQRGVPMFLLGGAPGAAEEARSQLTTRFAAARIAGAWSGGRAAAFDDRQTMDRIRDSGARVVAVAYGAPTQNQWIERNRVALDEAGVRIAIGVGGTLDYLSGSVARAPEMVRRIGLEFAWRLAREPWRWRRQLVLPIFAMRAGSEAFSRRLDRG